MIISINIEPEIYEENHEKFKKKNSLSWNIKDYLENPKNYKK